MWWTPNNQNALNKSLRYLFDHPGLVSGRGSVLIVQINTKLSATGMAGGRILGLTTLYLPSLPPSPETGRKMSVFWLMLPPTNQMEWRYFTNRQLLQTETLNLLQRKDSAKSLSHSSQTSCSSGNTGAAGEKVQRRSGNRRGPSSVFYYGVLKTNINDTQANWDELVSATPHI